MFRTGAKFFYALAFVAFAAAFFYAGATGDHSVNMSTLVGPISLGYKGRVGDHIGYTIFIGLGFAALFLGIVTSALRDADPDAAAQVAGVETVPVAEAPRTSSYWPIVAGFSAGCVALGLAVDKTFFLIGMVGLAVTTIEWAASAWADRATGDPEVNRAIRSRFMSPVEIPGAAVLVIGGFVLLVSRVLLAVPEVGSAIVFGGIPTVILVVAVVIALKPKLSSSVVAGLCLVGGLAILVGGVVAGVHGHRKIEEHHEKGEKGGEGEGSTGPLLVPGRPLTGVGG